jgi:aldehyde:ferredoxin oxidoreductase
MGSKNLRAVAVRGNQRYQTLAHDPAALIELGRTIAKRVPENPLSWDLQQHGTPGIVESLNASGILPTRNFQQGVFENVDQVKWESYEKEILTGRRSCYACAIRCKREAKVQGRVSPYGGPEYETVDAFGPNCGIGDLSLVARANELCNAYMLDSISTGSVIAWNALSTD